jgi:hypothetical protein
MSEMEPDEGLDATEREDPDRKTWQAVEETDDQDAGDAAASDASASDADRKTWQ